MLNKILYRISAERTDLDNDFLSPFYYQQLKAYEFCLKYCKNKRVLDIGSGAGHGSFLISEIAQKVISIDKEKLAILSSKKKFKRNNLEFINNSIEEFKTSDNFDCIVCLQVIEHIPQQSVEQFLINVRKLISTDGFLILSTPYSKNSSYNENPYHFKEYTFTELKKILSEFFTNIKIYSLIGDKKVRDFETERKQKVISILRIDYFRLRNLLPRRIKQILFDLLSYKKRTNLSELHSEITTKNYKIIEGEDTEAIDIITVLKI